MLAVRIGTAVVWIIFGLVFKVLNLVPRHETIVATVLGPEWAGLVTLLVGVAEVLLGIWILTGRWPIACIVTQTVAIVSMNVLELMRASEHLLSPVGMVIANVIFLTLGWWLAVRTAQARS